MQEAPFDRYADLNGLSDLRLSMNTVFTAARRRRWVRQPAKGAIFASNPLTLDVVRMYERLMDGATALSARLRTAQCCRRGPGPGRNPLLSC